MVLGSAMIYSWRLMPSSSSACALASTSRRRIFSAPPPASVAARGAQPVRDGLLARLDCAEQRRPDEPDREPDEQRKRDGLRDQREVEAHCSPLRGTGQRMTASRGLANANIIARPTPMMNDASIRPSSRNTLALGELVSSGWRAAASRKRLHMMPTPMHAPAAPTPIMRPMPIPV